jgi:hypothetical protein
MNRMWVRLTLTILAFGSFCARRSLACSCGQLPPGNCGEMAAIGPSFVGTVTDIENPADERRGADQSGLSRYRFRVDENISGFAEKEVDVYSGRGGGDCSYHFRMGQSYFVAPFKRTPSENLMAGICTGTQPTANAGPLLEELRSWRDGKRGASVEGIIRRKQQPYDSTFYAFYNHPISAVTVELRSGNRSYSTQTAEGGIYHFDGVPAGTYHFATKLPPNFELAQNTPGEPVPSITVADRPCYKKDIDVVPTARIRGRVVNPKGLPLKSADVELFRRERYKESASGWWTVQSDMNGYFEFDHLTPGLYLVVFNSSNRFDPNLPYSRTFYPNAPDFETAVPIEIGKDELTDGDQEFLNADIHAIAVKPHPGAKE